MRGPLKVALAATLAAPWIEIVPAQSQTFRQNSETLLGFSSDGKLAAIRRNVGVQNMEDDTGPNWSLAYVVVEALPSNAVIQTFQLAADTTSVRSSDPSDVELFRDHWPTFEKAQAVEKWNDAMDHSFKIPRSSLQSPLGTWHVRVTVEGQGASIENDVLRSDDGESLSYRVTAPDVYSSPRKWRLVISIVDGKHVINLDADEVDAATRGAPMGGLSAYWPADGKTVIIETAPEMAGGDSPSYLIAKSLTAGKR